MQGQPKVAYFVKRYPRFSETFIVNEILAHEAAGHPVEIISLRPPEESHFQDILARVRAPVIRIPDKIKNADALWGLLQSAQDALPGAWNALARMTSLGAGDVGQAIAAAVICRQKGVDHIHAHFGTTATSVARLAAELAGISYSFTAHAKDIFCEQDSSQDLGSKIRDAAQVVTVSDWNVNYLKERFGTEADQVIRIYNGLDLERFAYEAPATDTNEILAVGRLVEKKGFHVLIEAIRLLRARGRHAYCRIIGAGTEAANLAAQVMANDLGDAIEFAGPLPQAEVVKAMRRGAVFACPSIVAREGDRDGLPTVLLEAMALGIPVVASDVTGIPELVRDGETGLCVAESDAEALADAFTQILDNPLLRLKFSRQARDLIERDFDIRTNAESLRAMFARAAEDRPLMKGVA